MFTRFSHLRDCDQPVSVLVERRQVLDLLERHGLGNELDFNFFALLKHALGSRGRARVHIDGHPLVWHLLEQLVYGGHKAAEKECWVIQVDENETVRRVLADRAADRVDGGLFQERLVAPEAKPLFEERNEIGAAHQQALWVVAHWLGRTRHRCYGVLLLLHVRSISVHLVVADGGGFSQRRMADLALFCHKTVRSALKWRHVGAAEG